MMNDIEAGFHATHRSERNGPYDALYAAAPDHILWGENPTHLIKALSELSDNSHVLDIGCGDGVNALALERRGYLVTGVDVSTLALKGLYNRFRISGTRMVGSYLNTAVTDFVRLQPTEQFDALISCGLFHCLQRSDRGRVHRALQMKIRRGGLVLFSSLVDDIPLPEDHHTDRFDLPSTNEITALFDDWIIRSTQLGVIDDRHPPAVGPHQHSVFWLVAERP
jgi:cyclopropane fatty-acyl-phospholipid synthase-like methyltransferase